MSNAPTHIADDTFAALRIAVQRGAIKPDEVYEIFEVITRFSKQAGTDLGDAAPQHVATQLDSLAMQALDPDGYELIKVVARFSNRCGVSMGDEATQYVAKTLHNLGMQALDMQRVAQGRVCPVQAPILADEWVKAAQEEAANSQPC